MASAETLISANDISPTLLARVDSRHDGRTAISIARAADQGLEDGRCMRCKSIESSVRIRRITLVRLTDDHSAACGLSHAAARRAASRDESRGSGGPNERPHVGCCGELGSAFAHLHYRL